MEKDLIGINLPERGLEVIMYYKLSTTLVSIRELRRAVRGLN